MISQEHPLQPEIRAMVSELNEYLLALSPPEYCFHMTAEEMAGPENTVLVAREETPGNLPGKAVAMGSLRRHPDGSAEIKRVYTRPQARGQGLAEAILNRLEMIALEEGITWLVLETGTDRPACALYEKLGYAERGPFHDYPDSEYSKFYEKHLRTEKAA